MSPQAIERNTHVEEASPDPQVVAKVAIAVAREIDFAAMVAAVLDQTIRSLGASVAHVFTADEDRRKLDLVAHRGIPADIVERIRHVTFDEPFLAADAARAGAVRIVGSADELDPRLVIAREIMDRTGCRSMLAVPLIERGRLVGVLTFAQRARRFTAAELATVRACAEVFALGISRAHAFERERDLRLRFDAERAGLRAVLSSAPHAIVFVDRVSGRIRANPRAAELLGESPDEGRPLADYAGRVCLPDGTSLAVEDFPLSRALRGERLHGIELVMKRRDGGETPVFSSAGPVVGEDGEVLGAVVFFEDMTVLKELERLREDWAAIVAHDLRQPLSLIVSSLWLLHEAMDAFASNDDASAAMRHAEAAAHRLDKMISDLLDVSRLEASRMTLERSQVDVAGFVREVADRARIVTDAHVMVEVRGVIPILQADPMRLEQILSNLLTNAVKYGERGGDIELSVERVGSEVEVCVSNRGVTIPPEEAAHVFERYYRSHHARRGEARGLGLGLYITKGLVEAHGGRIGVDSHGEKTSFRFTLPIG
jgi:PAS domain S-box-containing protein